MKKQNQVRRNGSPAAAAPQRKSAYTKAGAGHQPTANGDAPSGFCLFDGAVGMEVCKLPLVRTQMNSVVKAVMIRGITTDQFISEAISEKLTRTPGTSARPEAVSPSGAVTVLLFDRDKEEEIERFDLTNAEFSRIRDAIAKTGNRPVDGAAVAAFVRESLLRSANRELLPGDPPTELEDAIAAANGLVYMLFSYLSSDEAENGRGSNQQHISDYFFLCKSIGERLKSAFNAMHAYAHGKAAITP